MWILNTDTNQWIKQTDTLSKDNYDNLKQDISKLKLYSKALSGASYLSISSDSNIYESLSYKDDKSWYINPYSSIYSIGSIPVNGSSIDRTSLSEFTKYKDEYGFTLVNNFTPEKSIEDINYLQVDVTTTEQININSALYTIDGVKLLNGQKILVKDQITTVDLSFSTDPNSYFTGNYYFVSNNVSDNTYYYYNNENGIYDYINGNLIKSTFSNYREYRDLKIYTKQGAVNFDKQFHLSRLLNGYFPSDNDPIEFKDGHSYLLRHQVDYHNLFENNYFDVLNHTTQLFTDVNGYVYTIPSRTIFIGDFGVLTVNQGTSASNYIYNDYKYNLKSITQTSGYYWVCGENGALLKISKVDLSISKIDIFDEFNTLTSISFLNDMRGVVVGKYNTIYYTIDGGFNWNKLDFFTDIIYSYNKVYYYNYNTIYIAGESGTFFVLNYSDLSTPNWSLSKKVIYKYLTPTDKYEMIEDINDICYTSFTASSWVLNYTGVTGSGISNNKECLFLVTNNSNIICYELNNFVPEYEFLYLGFSQSIGDITSIVRQTDSNKMIVSGNDVVTFDINTFDQVTVNSNLIIGDSYISTNIGYCNSLYYNNGTLFISGNNGMMQSYVYNYNPYDAYWNNGNGVTFSYFCYPAHSADFIVYGLNDLVLYEQVLYQSLIPSNNDNIPSLFPIYWAATGSIYDYTEPHDIPTEDINPKLLVLDYDMADKLNFFDSNYNYRLPVSITFSAFSGLTISTINSVKFEQQTSTWIDYLVDSYKVYGVNSDIMVDNPVVLNTTFAYGTSSCTFSSGLITSSFDEVKTLYPNVGNPTQSRYDSFSATYSGTYNVFIYKYITIIKLPVGFCSVGDMVRISSGDFTSNLLINYIYNNYCYAFNDFNKSIVNLIANGGVLTVTNLNKYLNYNSLVDNFEAHPLSDGYQLTYDNNIFTINGRFNNLTAYKPLNTIVTLQDVYGNNHVSNFKYLDNFNLFGYTPTYNILNYLNNINSYFTSSTVFYSMPQYVGLPGNMSNNFTVDNIYYDSNALTSWAKNSLAFGKNLKYEWDTLYINTFVDISIHTSVGTFNKTQVLIIDKYYNASIGGYMLIFDKKILDINNASVNSIDILSRNTLGQISSDLKLFDTVNKPLINKKYSNGDYANFNYYENPVKTKINTDSYAKILLSDGNIKKYLTAMIYTNDDNKLMLNTININTTNVININNSFNYMSNLGINVDSPINITSDLVFLNFIGGTGSSQQLNSSCIGMQHLNLIDSYNAYIQTPYLSVPTVQDIGLLKTYNFDPFFNYEPISLMDIGVDGMYKIPLEIKEENLSKSGLSASLINYKSNNFLFRLIDGLDINELSKNYHWILEAEIKNAIIGLDKNGLVWYKGLWESGRWFGGTWYSGDWLSGDWYGGTWSSTQVTDKINTVLVGTNVIDNSYSKWYNGRWFDGEWIAGTWLNGRRYNGLWRQGLWYNGIWNDGLWLSGEFLGGIWVQGKWEQGIFNSSNKPSYWINGNFKSGDFQNGMWYNGFFGQNYNLLSKFGTLASNSRNAIWQGGVFASGNFYSYENISATDSSINVSTIHKYSTWKTGTFNQGNFYGGVVYNIDFKSGQWYGGIVKDIEVIGVSNPIYSNSIVLNGIFRFNIGDYINLLNDGSSTIYYNMGNYDSPGRYRIANIGYDLTNNFTTVTIDYNFNTLSFTPPYNGTFSSNVNTGVRSVSKFNNITWGSGVWYNGIFEGGNFISGIWYDGLFTGNWGE